jgi:hypothetical protein
MAYEVKQYIADDNARRSVAHKNQGRVIRAGGAGSQDIGSTTAYLTQTNPKGSEPRFNLNGTMPVQGSNLNFMKTQQSDGNTGAFLFQDDVEAAIYGGHDSFDQKAVNEKINLEAYQAYYNTTEGN